MAGTSSSMGSNPNLGMQEQHAVDISNPPDQENKTPALDLLSGEARKDYLKIRVPMYKAALTGDWETAKGIINENPDVIRMSITHNQETALHIAVSARRVHFVEELVKKMDVKDLALQNKNGNTALCLAATAGIVKIAEVMVKKNETLPDIRGSQKMTPLYMAALFGHSSMVLYLYSVTNKLEDGIWTDGDRTGILRTCIDAELYDVALDMLQDPKVRVAESGDALHVLARKPSAFTGRSQNFIWRLINSIQHMRAGHVEKKTPAIQLVNIIWQKVIEQDDNDKISDIIRGPCVKKDGKDTWPSRLLFVAVETGNIRFLVELIGDYPDLIWKIDDFGRTIFHAAVLHRQQDIYNLLYEIGSIKDLIASHRDVNDNGILHLAAMKPKQNRLTIVSGVALQMQRELLWFKEVEQMVYPEYREKKNKEGFTPQELFTEEHKELVSKGEKWMKSTAAQCMVVAALIATIVFQAAFTLPGGNNSSQNDSSQDGTPIFLHKTSFIVFVISDAVSLISSSTSILMFLSILTSRYAEIDFLESLPTKLMIGLATLFLSITAMMVAFSSSFFIVYHNNLKWVPILITVLAAIPVILFAGLQYPLLADVIRSTHGSRYLFRPRTRMLY